MIAKDDKRNPLIDDKKRPLIKGMELSRKYFEAYGEPLIASEFAEYKDVIAAGLVGEGSECYGFDDEFSQDHDFGPGFCLWLPQTVYDEIGDSLQHSYDLLPKEFMGFQRHETPEGAGRVGVWSIEGFYCKFTNCAGMPRGNMEWLMIPETYLAVATNGAVFTDPAGRFTAVRRGLLGFYPEDVLRKKLAARFAVMAQSGQYNYPRCIKRGEFGASYLACSEFVSKALSAVYLLNGKYMPFYKWAFRGTRELTVLKGVVDDLGRLVSMGSDEDWGSAKTDLIEKICSEFVTELNLRGLSAAGSDFLMDHCNHIMEGISDGQLRGLPVMADCQ